jgi:AcrR family transcriptional regulator
MIQAAQQLFVERGYGGTTMADIASRADVAVQTLYFTFHTKAELLSACYDMAVLGDKAPAPPQQQGWYRSMLAARTGPAALGSFAKGNTGIVKRVALLDEVVRAAGHVSEALEIRQRHERLRRQGYGQLVAHLDQTSGLRPGLDHQTATDLLLTFGGPILYRTLVIDYGWRQDRYVDWLADTLVQQLLPDPD